MLQNKNGLLTNSMGLGRRTVFLFLEDEGQNREGIVSKCLS